MARRLKFICLGIITGLMVIYTVAGVLIVSGTITPVRFYLDGVYLGLLPTYRAGQKAKLIDKKSTKNLTFNYNQQTISLAGDGLFYQSIDKSFNLYLENFQSKTWRQRWLIYNRSLITNINLKPVLDINLLLIINKLETAYSGSWHRPQPAKLSYDPVKHIHLIPAKDGYIIDEAGLAKKIKTYLLDPQPKPIPIPLKYISLTPSKSAIQTGLAKATKLLKSQISLKHNQKQNNLTNQEKIALISLYKTIDEDVLDEMVSAKKQVFNQSPKNALFQYEAGRAKLFKPSQDGFELDTLRLKEQIKQAFIRATDGQGPAEDIIIHVVGQVIKPDITTLDSNNYGIKELVGQGESWFAHSIANRVHNIALAASKMNGVLVAPGEVFSFNKYLGDVSARTGYKSSYVIKNGKTILGDGGGVCQVSTTLFRAVLNAGLPIIERRAHSYRVSYYEQKSQVGLDATVYAPYADFKFKNDLASYLLIQTQIDKKKMHLVFKLYGTKDNRRVKLSKVRIWDQSPPPPPIYQDDPSLLPGTTRQIEWAAWGAKAAFDWTVEKNGRIIYQKTFYSAYKPWRAVYLKN